jgi:hypothetical protein
LPPSSGFPYSQSFIGHSLLARYARLAHFREKVCAMNQTIIFVSTCPTCEREQPQDAFSVPDLLRLINGGYPIEAYCVPCDKFWSISVQERIELGEAVSKGHPKQSSSLMV